MIRLSWLFVVAGLLAPAGAAYAQYPIMDRVADKVIQKYQSATCQQLWQNRGKQNAEEQRAIGFLKGDPQMREAFFNRIAGPVMNKMFECGMIP